MNRRTRFQFLGAVWTVLGLAIAVTAVASVVASPPRADPHPLPIAVLRMSVGAVLIATGVSLLTRRSWARTLVIVVSAMIFFLSLALPRFSVLALLALSIYGLWLMASAKGKESFGAYVVEGEGGGPRGNADLLAAPAAASGVSMVLGLVGMLACLWLFTLEPSKATAILALYALAVALPAGILAVVLGVEIRSRATSRSRGVATAGVALGVGALALTVFVLMMTAFGVLSGTPL